MQTIKLLQELAVLGMQCGILILFLLFIYWAILWSIDEHRERKETREHHRKLKQQMDDIQKQRNVELLKQSLK